MGDYATMKSDPGLEGQAPLYREVAMNTVAEKSKGNVEDRIDRLYSLVDSLKGARCRLSDRLAPALLPEQDGKDPGMASPVPQMSTIATTLDDLGDSIASEIHALSVLLDRCDL